MSTTTTAIAALNRAVYYLDRGFEPAAKAKAFTRAAEVAAGMDDDDLERRAEAGTLTDLDGIGPSTASVIADAVLDRPPAYLTKLEQRTRLRVSAGATVFEACRSDLHSHSTWSDGGAPIRTMAMTARALGRTHLALTDHSPRLTIAHGLTPERLAEQLIEVAALNEELAPFRILTGCEVDILADGTLDLPDDVLAGLEEKVGQLEGVEYQWIAPPTGNPAEQVQILEDLINKGVNGIGLAPLEAASVEPVIAQARAAGIPVVTFDSDAPNSERVAYYGTDNRAAGRQQAEVMAEALGGKGKVAIVTGSLVMANLNERIEGVEEAIAEKYPDIELVDTIATDDDFAKGLDVCEAMLRAHPDLNGVIAVSMTGSVAMPKVLADPAFADRDDLVVVGFDDFEDTLKGIRDGYILATMVQRPKQMGIYVIEGLFGLNTGGAAESVDTGITVVTLDNIDTYK